ALSSAYQPIAGVLTTEHVYETMARESHRLGFFGHGHTYSGHPVACAVALETIRIIEERNLVGHVQTISPRFLDGLARFESLPIVGNARGIGLMAALEIVADKATKEPFPAAAGVGPLLQERAAHYGLLVRWSNNAAILAPPLIITAEE